MTATTAPPRSRPRSRSGRGARVLRAVGWTLIAAGIVVLLYLVHSLFFTNLETNAAQDELREEWEALVAAPLATPDDESATTDEAAPERADSELADPEAPADPEAAPAEPDAEAPADPDPAPAEPEQPQAGAAPAAPELGSAVAMVEFVRPGSAQRPVRDDPLLVVEGVTREALTRGPGRYPGTAMPGEEGNLAIAGHRTTYGAPFFKLDELEPGDEVHVTDRNGQRHRYRVAEQRVVAPDETWVLGHDPLQRGAPLLTLTSCHPRFSARQRLIVFAELMP